MVFILFLACADNWQHADLQLELTNAAWEHESRIRICIAQQQTHQSAVQDGRVALDFLNFPIEATIQLLPTIENGNNPTHEIQTSFQNKGHYTEAWMRCDQGNCAPCDSDEILDSGSILMAIRLNDQEQEG